MHFKVYPHSVAASAAGAAASSAKRLLAEKHRHHACLLAAVFPKKYQPACSSPVESPAVSAGAFVFPGPDHTASLPDELLLEIFRHVDRAELVRSVQRVSPRWARVVHDDALWREYEYAPARHSSSAEAVRVLRRSPRLRAFSLPPGIDADAALDALSNRCRLLERLNLEVESRINVRVLKSLFTRLPELRHLQLTQRGMRTRRLALRFRPPSSDPAEMSYFYESLDPKVYQSQTYIFVAKFVLKLKKNEIDEIRLNFVYDEMLDLVKQCSGLEKLRLDFDEYQDEMKTDLKFVRDLQKLESLSMVNYHNDTVLNEIFSKGPWLTLKELNLSWCTTLSDKTCTVIAKNCPNLEKIILDCCPNVTDKGVRHLSKNGTLHFVKMSSCPLLTSESVRHVTTNKSLVHLDLTNFLGPVADYLPHLLHHKTLQCLSLKGCIITCGDIALLSHHLKHTTLHMDPPKVK